MKLKKRLMAIALILIICLCTACAKTKPEIESQPETVQQQGEAVKDKVPYGKPFTTTIDSGNLPETKGSPADDLNVYYNFDFFNERKDKLANDVYMVSGIGEYKENVLKFIEDESITAPGLDQLRLFFKQAMDMETADERGLKDVEPFVNMIDSADSIAKLNEVLSSPDFPFSPFLTSIIWSYDLSDVNILGLYPNYLLFDFLDGAQYLQDTDDPDEKINIATMQLLKIPLNFLTGKILETFGIPSEETGNVNQTMLDFEKLYGKYGYYDNLALKTEYGELGQFYNLLTLDELEKKVHNFPVRGILKKDGRDISKLYNVMNVEWMEKLDELWTEDNLDILKTIAKVKVMMECAPYLTTEFQKTIAFGDAFASGDMSKLAEPDNIEINLTDRAYNACDSLDTFSQLMGQLYIDNYVGGTAQERLRDLAEGLRATYIEMFENTSWLDEDSKAALMEKILGMTFNILGPESGYFDFGKVKLLSNEEGGTLIGNYLTLKKFRIEQENDMIGKPSDSGFLFNAMKSSTTNCFYVPEGNSINIMPGFINSCMYQDSYADEELMGGIGYVIAHEISHGFDNLGSQYDVDGMLNCCFTPEAQDNYLDLCDKIRKYYDGIYVVEGKYVNGQKVLAEACADLCGMDVLIELSKDIPGFDYEKFYQRIALDYRDVSSPGSASMMLAIDTHPLSHLRINVNAQMNDKFYEVYDVKEGDNMYVAPENRLYLYGK